MQCGGYVRKHGKLSEERRERVAAQQMAAAIAAVSAPVADPAPAPAPVPTPAAPSGLGSSLGNSGLSLPGLGLPSHPHLPLFVSPANMPPPPPLPSLVAVQAQQPSDGEAAAAAAMSDVGCLAGGLRDSTSPPDLAAQQAQHAEQQGEAMEVEDAADPPSDDPPADAMQVDSCEQAAACSPSAADAEAAAAAAALAAAVFAPWQAELDVLREQRQAVAALVRAAFAPHLPQPEAQQAVKQEPVDVKQQPVEALLPGLNLQLPLPQLPAAASLEPPAAACALRRSAAVSAAAAAPARSASGSLRRAAAANHAAAAPQVGCGDSCLNRISFIHCDRATCPCGDRCTNRPFVELASPAMEVFLTPDKGWGVRAAAFIPRGSFIVEYAGEVRGRGACGEDRSWGGRARIGTAWGLYCSSAGGLNLSYAACFSIPSA